MQTAKYNYKWLFVGFLIALFNPIFSGLIIGGAYLTDKQLRREGWLVLGFTVLWALVVTVFKKRLNL